MTPGVTVADPAVPVVPAGPALPAGPVLPAGLAGLPTASGGGVGGSLGAQVRPAEDERPADGGSQPVVADTDQDLGCRCR